MLNLEFFVEESLFGIPQALQKCMKINKPPTLGKNFGSLVRLYITTHYRPIESVFALKIGFLQLFILLSYLKSTLVNYYF